MNERTSTSIFRAFTAFLSAFFLLTSCGQEEPLPVSEAKNEVVNESNAHVNSWIQDNMDYWYLWNKGLPSSSGKNLDPESYFESLLDPQDRFSWIQENYRDLLNSLQGITKEAGYEFVLYREKEGSDNVILQILYIKPGSPAATAGLKRGDVITHINDQQITSQNYQEIVSSIKKDHTVRFKPLLIAEERLGELKSASLSAVEYSENPNYLHKVIEIDGRRIGYFVYNFFASGTDRQPGIYDAETDAIFAALKSKGITDLVLDLRFNSGGSESSAKNLASLIGRGVDNTKVFLKRQYNETVQEAIMSDENLGEDHLISHYATESGNIGNQLASGRLYVLTSSRTASASELIINALRPFMEVFIIGDTTYGKNVGSISLFEEKDPKNMWGMQPIVVKVFNSQDQSDYSSGFTPNVLHKDNSLYLYPLGDPREALLSHAIGQITGTATTAREDRERRKPLAHSLDFRRHSFNLIMDERSIPYIRP